jgi:hypothetical protein
MPDTLDALAALDIRLPVGFGYRFRGIRFIERDLRAAADFPEGCGIGIRRPVLHELLVRKAKESGVRLLWNTPVSGISAEGVCVAGASPAGVLDSRSRWKRIPNPEVERVGRQPPSHAALRHETPLSPTTLGQARRNLLGSARASLRHANFGGRSLYCDDCQTGRGRAVRAGPG